MMFDHTPGGLWSSMGRERAGTVGPRVLYQGKIAAIPNGNRAFTLLYLVGYVRRALWVVGDA